MVRDPIKSDSKRNECKVYSIWTDYYPFWHHQQQRIVFINTFIFAILITARITSSMKRYFKPIASVVLAVSVLIGAGWAASASRGGSKALAKELDQSERRVLPVLVFGGIHLVWKMFSVENN